MSFAHHGEPQPRRELSPELRAALDSVVDGNFKQKSLVERFKQEAAGTAKREFPDGRINETDDGSLTFIVSSDSDKQVVKIDFSKPTEWIGMSPQQAIEFAKLLIRHARGIATSPLIVQLY